MNCEMDTSHRKQHTAMGPAQHHQPLQQDLLINPKRLRSQDPPASSAGYNHYGAATDCESRSGSRSLKISKHHHDMPSSPPHGRGKTLIKPLRLAYDEATSPPFKQPTTRHRTLSEELLSPMSPVRERMVTRSWSTELVKLTMAAQAVATDAARRDTSATTTAVATPPLSPICPPTTRSAASRQKGLPPAALSLSPTGSHDSAFKTPPLSPSWSTSSSPRSHGRTAVRSPPSNRRQSNTRSRRAAATVAGSKIRGAAAASYSKQRANGGRWTRAEDEELKKAVNAIRKESGSGSAKQNGAGKSSSKKKQKKDAEAVGSAEDLDWVYIAEGYMEGKRTAEQCQRRWEKVLEPGYVKGPWRPEEDAIIRKCIEMGITDWQEVSDQIPGRVGKQCRERWQNHIDPSLKKTPWTVEEDTLLEAAQAKYGNSWMKIAKCLPGRSENAIKNRWNSASRIKLKGAAAKQKAAGALAAAERKSDIALAVAAAITPPTGTSAPKPSTTTRTSRGRPKKTRQQYEVTETDEHDDALSSDDGEDEEEEENCQEETEAEVKTVEERVSSDRPVPKQSQLGVGTKSVKRKGKAKANRRCTAVKGKQDRGSCKLNEETDKSLEADAEDGGSGGTSRPARSQSFTGFETETSAELGFGGKSTLRGAMSVQSFFASSCFSGFSMAAALPATTSSSSASYLPAAPAKLPAGSRHARDDSLDLQQLFETHMLSPTMQHHCTAAKNLRNDCNGHFDGGNYYNDNRNDGAQGAPHHHHYANNNNKNNNVGGYHRSGYIGGNGASSSVVGNGSGLYSHCPAPLMSQQQHYHHVSADSPGTMWEGMRDNNEGGPTARLANTNTNANASSNAGTPSSLIPSMGGSEICFDDILPTSLYMQVEDDNHSRAATGGFSAPCSPSYASTSSTVFSNIMVNTPPLHYAATVHATQAVVPGITDAAPSNHVDTSSDDVVNGSTTGPASARAGGSARGMASDSEHGNGSRQHLHHHHLPPQFAALVHGGSVV